MQLTIGDSFTTSKSNVTGTIMEVVANDSGSYRVRLATPNGDRWTTVKYNNCYC